jgi:hypothetical protein
VVRIRAAPCAGWLIEQVANYGVGTTAGDHSGGLVRQLLGGINHFGFQRDLVPNVFAILDVSDLPSTEGHLNLQITPQVYEMSDMPASDTRHEQG